MISYLEVVARCQCCYRHLSQTSTTVCVLHMGTDCPALQWSCPEPTYTDAVQLKMQQELSNTQEVALKLEAQNKDAMRDAQRMRADFKSQQQERERVIAQNLILKRENKALQATVLNLRDRFESMFADEEEGTMAKV
jgi:hypothetical protein